MKLDVNVLRHLTRDDFRTLTAVEQGQKNHEIVPVPLIDAIAGLRHGSTVRCLRILLRSKLVHHDNSKYDGYRLTPLGYDYLALRALSAGGHVAAVGRPLGVGKESDVFEVATSADAAAPSAALKLHRLGRTSFRAVANKRDYLGTRTSYSWLYLSRLAAAREAAFMAALSAAGFPVPRLLAVNRHAVLMSAVDGTPLHRAREGDVADPAALYRSAVDMMEDLAARGLVHADFNEFNLLLSPDGASLTLIDFPQMVAASHPNARELFDRDAAVLARFFGVKLGYDPASDPSLSPRRPGGLASFDAARARAAPVAGDGGRAVRRAARRDAHGDAGAGGGAAAVAAAVAAAAVGAAGEGGDLAAALSASGFRARDERALEAALRGGGGEEEEEEGAEGGTSEDASDGASTSSSSSSSSSHASSLAAAAVAACELKEEGEAAADAADAAPLPPPPPTPDRRAAVAARVAAEARSAAKARVASGAARGAARATSKAKRRGTRASAV